MIAYGPVPTVGVHDALRSTTARAERDHQLAAWCGLPDDEVGPFLRRLAEFDARTQVWVERQAQREAELVRLDADLSDFWHRYPSSAPPATPTRIGTRLGSRLTERL